MDRDEPPLTNGPATAGILLALLALAAVLTPYYGIFAVVPALLAIAFGRAGWRRSKTAYRPGRVRSIAAIGLGSITAVLGALSIYPGWQAESYPVTEPRLKDLTPVTCAQFDLPDDWSITYLAVFRPIWVIQWEGSDGELDYAALRYRSESCKHHPEIAPLLEPG